DALDIMARYRIDAAPAVARWLADAHSETVKPGDARLQHSELRMIATPQRALQAAARVASEAGLTPYILGDSLEGEARDVGKVLAGITRQVATRAQPVAAPCVLLCGGETTVTLRGNGRGGRNVEFLLSLAVGLEGLPGVHALA